MNLPKDFPFKPSSVYTYGVRNGIIWAEDPSKLVASDSIEMSMPLFVECTLRPADAVHKLVPDYAVPVYCYVPTPKEKVRPPKKPQFAGSDLGQREGGVDGYHEWQGFGVGWSDFKPHHPEEFYTEDEVGMPSLKNPMGSR